MSESRLLLRLMDLRRTVRRRLILCGVCAVASGAVFAFLAVALLDWLLWLPPAPRVFMGVLYLAGGVVAVWHWIVRPLREPLGLSQIAGKLEEYNWQFEDGQTTRFEDRLSSTVEFLLGNQAGSERMRQQVIANTDRIVEHIRFRDALSTKPLAVRGASLVLAILLLGTVAWASPGFVRTGLDRYVSPLGSVEWPRDQQIVPLTTDLLVAIGESAGLRMRIVRGQEPTLRSVVHLRSTDGQRTTLAMRREGDGEYATTVTDIAGDLTCWFEAGDDNTADRPLHIVVVPRPTVVEALVSIDPPAYAVHAVPVLSDLAAGDLSAVLGSTLHLSIRTTKPIGTDHDRAATASLEFTDGTTVALHFVNADRQLLEADFTLTADAQLRARVVDTDGFENRGGAIYRIQALPDRPPKVVILEPRAVTEVTPDGSVSLLIRADDDFGLTAMNLIGRNLDTDAPFELPLTDQMSVSPAGDLVLGLVEHVWDIASLRLEPGAALVYQAEATDNLPTPGPQVGRSAQLRLKIISQADFENRLRDELALLQDRIRRAMLDQQTLNDETRALAAAAPIRGLESGRTEVRGSPSAAGQSGSQVRLANRVRDLSRRLDRLGKRMTFNGVRDAQQRDQVRRMALSLQQTASGPMLSAVRRLAEAARGDTADRRGLLDQADADQRAAIQALARIIRLMDQWGDFQEVVTKTRDLLDRQQNLRNATQELGRRTLGQVPETLSDAEQAGLRTTQRKQTQLADEASSLLDRLRQLADRIRAKDPAGADALEQAFRAAAADEVVQRMRDAAEASGQNRTAAAVIDQRAAERGLADMLAGLRQRQERELAELVKRIQSAERAVADILQQQRDLLAANLEAQRLASQPEVFVKQGGQQQALKRNTLRLADDLADMPEASGSAPTVRRAAQPMGRAQQALDGAQGNQADDHQADAIDLLAEAVLELQTLAEQAAEQALKRSLARLGAKLEAIRSRQQEINRETEQLILRLVDKGQLGRVEYRRVARLAGMQQDIRPAVQEVQGELGDAAVYQWVISRVLELIDTVAGALGDRSLDDVLAHDQQSIVDELDLLIDAIAAVACLPTPDEYAEEMSSGGGGMHSGDDSPIPSVAELLVLKAMQLSLNERTAKLADQFDPATATEAQLRQVHRIADRQQQIRKLTSTVTQRAGGD